LLSIDVIVPVRGSRLWHQVLIERLRSAGHDVAIIRTAGAPAWPWSVVLALAFERLLRPRRVPGLATNLSGIPVAPKAREAKLRVDLSGSQAVLEHPTITLAFDGSYADVSAVVALAEGRRPNIEAILDGSQVVGFAAPMVDTPELLTLGIDDVLARAITLLTSLVAAFESGRLNEGTGEATLRQVPQHVGVRFLKAYFGSALPRLAREVLRRARFRQAHWRVGYRFIDGPGVAETGRLGGGWAVLPDRGDRFYADPFAFVLGHRQFIFVEDYPHAIGKAVISVVEFDDGGAPRPPRPVLEEPWHLSYPQVFARDGEIWMLPEASGSGKLTLYRADAFPDRWTPVEVLIEHREISDATLIEHGDRLWLLATERDGHGSTSDTLVAFHAPTLLGPWVPHEGNPLLIDRGGARPGGGATLREGRHVLPVQDGTKGYGGGLGLSIIETLDQQVVRLGPPQPIDLTGDWPYPRIHTLNRAGRLEVIDGIAVVRKG
jgi:hypothetical protein